MTKQDETLLLFRNCIPLFQALGDSVRQDIILLLAEAEHLNVNQLTDKLPLSRPAISHHLKVLKDTKLVTVTRRGTENYYSLELSLAIEDIKKLIQSVEENC